MHTLQVQYEPSIDVQNLTFRRKRNFNNSFKAKLTIVENGQWYYKLYTKIKESYG